MNISNIDAVDIVELGQVLLCSEGQVCLQKYLLKDKQAALVMLWGAVNTPFLPNTALHRVAYDKLEGMHLDEMLSDAKSLEEG